MVKLALVLAIAVLVVACGTTQQDVFVRKSQGFASVSEELNYHLLLAEMAMVRNELGVAAMEYNRAAMLSGDPELARRATHVAFDADLTEVILSSAQRWAHLAPTALEPHHFLAVIAVRQDRSADAVKHFERILQGDTGAVDANFTTVITLLLQEQRNGAALQTMQTLVAEHGDSAAAYYGLALIASSTGQTRIARDAAEKSVQLDPEKIPAQVLFARLRIANGERENVLDAIEKIVADNPGDIRNRYTYASLLLQMERNTDAQREFEIILEAEPESADALFAVGLIEIEAKNFEIAGKYFRNLLATGQRNSQAYFYLGAIAEEQERFEDAVDWYRQVTAQSHFVDAQMRIARVLIKLDRLDSARYFIAEMRDANPTMAVDLFLAEAELVSKHADNNAAYEVYAEGLHAFPENLDIIYARALFAARVGNIEQSISDFRILIEREPDDPDFLNAFGYTLADMTDRYDEARGMIERALAFKPDEPAIIDSMGWVLFKLGDFAQAISYLERAFEMTGDGEIGAHLGEVLWKTGELNAARETWNKAKEKFPENPVLIKTMERFSQ